MEGESTYKQQQPSDSNSHREAEIKLEPNQKCPRCDSVNTRFCYFNNHKTSQPRYICKNCKRFWTQGGNVRNIQSNGGEQRMKRAREFSSSGGSGKDSPSTAVSPPPPPPLAIVSNGGNVRRVGALNFTRPQPVANQPRLKFVRVDINRLSLTQGYNRVLNLYMVSPQTQGQSYPFLPNGQIHQASYHQGFEAHQRKPNNYLGIARWDPSCLHSAGTSYYPEPGNRNILWESRIQIGHPRGPLPSSSSSAWYAQLPR